MSDELTVRIAEVLAAHGGIDVRSTSRSTKRGDFTEHQRVCSGCGFGLPWPTKDAYPALTAHQAEQVRAVLGETTTEWVATYRWDSGVEEIAYRGHSEADAREMDANILRSRTVTPWIEVPS